MTVAGASYSINHNRIRRGLYPGFELKEDGTLILDPREGIHMLYRKFGSKTSKYALTQYRRQSQRYACRGKFGSKTSKYALTQ